MSGLPGKPSPLFPGPEVKLRDDLPTLEKVKKPSIVPTLVREGRNMPIFINRGIFPMAGQEPLTEMQRKAEMFEFSAILEKVRASCSEHMHEGKMTCTNPSLRRQHLFEGPIYYI